MDCIFCKIAEGSIPSQKVFENERVIAFRDIQPAAPVHIVIIPRKHIASLNDVKEEDISLIADLHYAAQQIAKELHVDKTGYRMINNCGEDGGQTVHHLHYHLLGGAKIGPLSAISDSHA